MLNSKLTELLLHVHCIAVIFGWIEQYLLEAFRIIFAALKFVDDLSIRAVLGMPQVVVSLPMNVLALVRRVTLDCNLLKIKESQERRDNPLEFSGEGQTFNEVIDPFFLVSNGLLKLL